MVSVFDVGMRQSHAWLRLGLLTMTLAFAGCENGTELTAQSTDSDPNDGPLTVYTVNYPLAWLADRIGGDAVDVRLPIPEGVDPAHWQPTAETIIEYQDADLILLNGAGYADWVQYASLSPNRSVDTTKGIEELLVATGGATHSHGPEGAHDHGAVASHTWLDPTIASRQAEAVMNALVAHGAGEEHMLRERLTTVQAELSELDRRLEAALGQRGDARFLFSHPVYQYLNSRYALDGHSVVWEPDEEPGGAEWRDLSAELGGHRSWVMLWEAEPLASTADRLQSLGIRPVVFITGARAPAEGDYLSIMNENLERLSFVAEQPLGSSRQGE